LHQTANFLTGTRFYVKICIRSPDSSRIILSSYSNDSIWRMT